MDEYARGFMWGLIVGCVGMILIWVAVAEKVEGRKIASGYLTHHQRVYTVELFDTLDTPEGEPESRD